MNISDTISRASLLDKELSAETLDELVYQLREDQQLQREVKDTNNDDVIFVTNQRLQQIKLETLQNTSLQDLISLISCGWPENKTEISLLVHEYWPYHDELATLNGFVFRETQIVIPHKICHEMIKIAHAPHLSTNSTLNTARDIMY